MLKCFNPFRNFYLNNNLIKNISSVHKYNVRTFKCAAENGLNFNSYVTNRNPRNLERIRIARKPTGYHLDKPGRTFWHKVFIVQKPRYVIANVCHNNGSIAIKASTNEWGLSKHLFRCNDINAYAILAQVLAERCLQSGISVMINGICSDSCKQKLFVTHLEESGIVLTEPPTYTPLTPWNRGVDVKPWKICENA